MNSDSIFASLSPGDLRLPAKFTSYRGPQREALEWLIESCHAPVSAALLPTGIGKTLLAVSLAKLSRVKTVYLVATKALQARDEWTVWANGQIERSKAVKEKIELRLPNSYRREVRWKEADDLQERATRISRMSGNFVWQFDDRGHVTFSPIRVSPWTKQLFAGVPRVLLMSASLNPFVLRLLMGDAGCDYDYRAWPPVFPQSNAPVYHIPTRKLSWRSTDEDYKAIIEKADAIIDRRTDRKGIIHTVSYARSFKCHAALQRQNIRVFQRCFDSTAQLGPVLDLGCDGAVCRLGFQPCRQDQVIGQLD